MISLNWVKCGGGVWCELALVNLENVNNTGVYVIWHGGQPSRYVRVGQGDIKDRLSKHRNDKEILASDFLM